MNTIHNFTNRNLCEYVSIFPTVASLLDHLLFTVGNGYEFDEDSGMIFDEMGIRIDQYPAKSAVYWEDLIAECHAKEYRWASKFVPLGIAVNEEKLAKECAKYRIVTVDDSMFTEDALYAELVVASAEKLAARFATDNFHRPYPLSEKYSDVFNLNLNTPKWFVQIALNLCKAWVRFLTEEIENNHVWIKPSLRPRDEVALATAAAMSELFDDIKADPAYDGWADNAKEAESDYGDLTWTTRHRNMLVEQVQRLEGLLNA